MIYYHLIRAEFDAALDLYARAVEQRHPIATELASATFLKELRSNPRWPKVTRVLNLPVMP